MMKQWTIAASLLCSHCSVPGTPGCVEHISALSLWLMSSHRSFCFSFCGWIFCVIAAHFLTIFYMVLCVPSYVGGFLRNTSLVVLFSALESALLHTSSFSSGLWWDPYERKVFNTCFYFSTSGYQRELLFQRDDGSFSAFGNDDPSGSTWWVVLPESLWNFSILVIFPASEKFLWSW